MTERDKQLLLKALCGYIPYRVQALVENVFSEPEDVEIEAVTSHQEANLDGYNFTVDIQNLKPYLRPMSSMTDEERKQLMDLCDITPYETQGLKIDEYGAGVFLNGICSVNSDVFDWLNAHRFDYRGLIEKGLALPAPDGMY